MKVKELIAALQTMPQDAEVFSYSSDMECDASIENIQICHQRQDYHRQMEEYYCSADSVAALYLSEFSDDAAVVVLKSN